MADDIVEQLRPHIHEILRIVLVKGRTLRELNELVGKSIGTLQSSKAADLPTSPTHLDIEGGGIVSLSPKGDMFPMTHGDGLNILDEYFQQRPMSSGPANNVEGLDKWLKSTPESIPQGDAPETAGWFNAEAVLAEPHHPPVAGTNSVSLRAPDIPDPGRPARAAMSELTSSVGSSDPGSLSTNHTICLPSETHHIAQDSASGVPCAPDVKRLILDESAQWLEHVLVALQAADDTTRRPNSSVPGILNDILTASHFTLCVKVMTSIAENLVKCSRCIAKPTVDLTQKRSREVERTKVGQHSRRLTSEHVSRALKQKKYSGNTTYLAIRDLAEREMQKIISEPEELTREFKEEGDYETTIRQIERENADETSARLRRLWKETYYWPMIQQRAKMIGPLPTPSGRKTEISPQEKIAAKRQILAMGYGKSRDNIYKWTAYWKLLSELRDKRARELLLYRTREFKAYFFQHPKEFAMLLSWNQVYNLPLRQLGVRTIAEEGDDFSGRSDIEEQCIFKRLHAPQNLCWGDHLSVWDHDLIEYESFIADHNIKPTSRNSNVDVLRHGLKGQPERNKSSFLTLVPYEGESGKRTLGTRSGSTEVLAIAPLVPVLPGDFLGIFSGRLRYTDQKPPRSIPGPAHNLWLDYSVVMGKLSRMGVAKADEMANVSLAWEGVNEVKGETSFCQYLRVLVIATRHIMPYDQLVRPSIV
ncbi:hypothetical protein LSUE1_G004472 [Lachnellula suecica]|uniref:Uncharacterized protein n=1 Tax=Lachnellula suecica TaxID=602035 RepID=A0A8T9BY91_9HELO|nr:hypothetical protein LSUE1_G004472 [Lachnellula suecica]